MPATKRVRISDPQPSPAVPPLSTGTTLPVYVQRTLRSMPMRVRKSIADGYQRPKDTKTGHGDGKKHETNAPKDGHGDGKKREISGQQKINVCRGKVETEVRVTQKQEDRAQLQDDGERNKIPSWLRPRPHRQQRTLEEFFTV
jgi:hypothetical protein